MEILKEILATIGICLQKSPKVTVFCNQCKHRAPIEGKTYSGEQGYFCYHPQRCRISTDYTTGKKTSVSSLCRSYNAEGKCKKFEAKK